MTTDSTAFISWVCVRVCVSGVGGKGCVNCVHWGCPGAGTGTSRGGGRRGRERTPPASSRRLCLPSACPPRASQPPTRPKPSRAPSDSPTITPASGRRRAPKLCCAQLTRVSNLPQTQPRALRPARGERQTDWLTPTTLSIYPENPP